MEQTDPKINIPFNRPFIIGNELEYIQDAVLSGIISGNGKYTKKCQEFMEKYLPSPHMLLTTSCTDALEMSALICNIQPGDEVILPSFTYVSTANSFALRGAHLVFVEIREDTLNLDERLIEAKITKKTSAIVPVHYAGVACEMDMIMDMAAFYGLTVIEDAAQALAAKYKGRNLGTIGDFGTFSFHETKNIICGEGGAISINNQKYRATADIVWEKGTNKREFSQGDVDKYEWLKLGSSFLPSDILAAFLYAQLENIEKIINRRQQIFERYHRALLPLERKGLLKVPSVPPECEISYHLFYLMLNDSQTRNALLHYLQSQGIMAIFHYIPLHSSPYGSRYGFKRDQLPITVRISERILRLPFYYELSEQDQDLIIDTIETFFINY
ncbi:dTDP-4-amino-4,6-dideoxygalactose transaminase [candidate division CSSED10-310 bacterium]|uniref:dTDP-4-amino-4,6-dideoxygalactose transaminase n=1 Tax=candidate division CSSED10-310 bacterium TaxID=2855610 RepID=A0ABV6YVE5_UNCC1